MITIDLKRGCIMVLAIAVLAALAGARVAQAAAPVKLVLTSHFGREVNLTEAGVKGGQALEDVCVIASGDECQQGVSSSEPGGFEHPAGVAGGANGDIYIADVGNNRVQELTATGSFVAMFGKDVNATTGGDICSEEEIKTSAVKCKAGIEGTAAGQFAEMQALAVDPVSGDIYVSEFTKVENGFGARVQEFTAEGRFVLEIGRQVNETTGTNLCTEREVEAVGVKCGGPAQSVPGAQTVERGAFVAPAALTVGGRGEHLLYVGDEHRIQEFNERGEWKDEIPLTAITAAPGFTVSSIAVDASGEIYFTYGNSLRGTDEVRQFDQAGEEVDSFTVPPRIAGRKVEIHGIAVDSSDHLAVWAYEGEGPPASGGNAQEFGGLYEANGGRLLTRFTTPESPYPDNFLSGVGFNSNGELLADFSERSEIWSYVSVQVGELETGNATCAVMAPSSQTSSTVDCQLSGEVNPYNVANTRVWFEWGVGAPGVCVPDSETAEQTVATGETAVQVGAQIEGLRPNQQFCYRLAGSDQRSEPPEKLTGEITSARTPVAAPKLIGQPDASFVTSFGVVISGELNPENAPTEYLVEYAPGDRMLEQLCPSGLGRESCSGVSRTTALEAEAYGQVGATLESRSLQPDTQYRYRLVAKNAAAEVLGAEGSFQTAAAPQVQAQTGAASSITTTEATVSGAVNPDGQSATYAFELGIYAGLATQYSVVFSGPAGSGAVPGTESLALTGLQPGTTYAYRIEVASGYGVAQGQTLLFTTAGLPAVLALPTPLLMLAVPEVAFPVASHLTLSKSSKPRSGGITKVRRACEKKAKQRRAQCKRQTRKQHARTKSANDREKQ